MILLGKLFAHLPMTCPDIINREFCLLEQWMTERRQVSQSQMNYYEIWLI